MKVVQKFRPNAKKEMESLLANAKKNQFYDRTQSDMIRELLLAGLDALDEKKKKMKHTDI